MEGVKDVDFTPPPFAGVNSIKNVVLHGDREVPPELELSSSNCKVCKLKKTPYGLKQSPRPWFERFSRVIFDYRQSRVDLTLFIKHSSQGKATTLIVYVDYIVLTGTDDEER
jgi:hypothetical protein